MYAGEKSLRALVDKWIGPGVPMTARVIEFSRTRSDRRRYARVGTFTGKNVLRSSSSGTMTDRGTSFHQGLTCRRCVPASLRHK